MSYNTGLVTKIINKIKKINGAINIRDLISHFMAVYGKGMPSEKNVLISDRLKNILNKEWSYGDFLLRDPMYLIKQLKLVISKSKRDCDCDFIPVVLIGHSKDFFFANNLAILLESCQNLEEIEFTSYFEAVKKVKSKGNKN
jgi:hypothetical protein